MVEKWDRLDVSLWIYWSLDGVGLAGEDVADVAAAVRALDISVTRGRRAFDSDTPWEALRASAELMKVRMLDEGHRTLERGEEWSAQIEGVQVRLLPHR